MSAKSLTQMRSKLVSLVRDADGELAEQDMNDALQAAARVLSKRTQRFAFVEQTGNGTTYEWALPTTGALWVPHFSTITRVEYPFDVTEQQAATVVDDEDWDVYEKTAGVWWFKTTGFIPQTAEVIRYSYTSFHTITDDASECSIVNPNDEQSVLYLAAYFCLMQLSTRAIAVGNPSIGADVVGYQTRSGEYERRAETYKKMSGLGPHLEEDEMAFVVFGRTTSTRRSDDGYPWLTHPPSDG